MKKKLVFINRFFHPDHSATSQMLSDLAFGIAERDEFDVHVVASRLRYDDPAVRLPALEQVAGLTVHRVWTSRFGRHNLWGRLLDYLSFYLAATVALFRLADARTTIVANTDPPLISVPAAAVAKLRSAGLVNWIQDLFPEVAGALGVGLAKGPVYGWLRRLRNFLLHAAEPNIAIGELMKARLIGEGVPPDRIAVIHNWADGAAITPVRPECNSLRTEWGLDGKFVVGYSGNLGRGHEFTTILEAADALRDDPRVVFLMIGGGANFVALREAVAARQLGNFVFKDYQPREILAASLSAADVHLVSLRPELEGLIVPSKCYGIAAADRPILFIGAEAGEVAGMVRRDGTGFRVAPDDFAGLAARILDMAGDPSAVAAMGRSARQVFDARYSLGAALDSWGAILARVGQAPNGKAVAASEAAAEAR